jgi:hypothetical protein
MMNEKECELRIFPTNFVAGVKKFRITEYRKARKDFGVLDTEVPIQ